MSTEARSRPIAAGLLALLCLSPVPAEAQRAVFVVRHAERADAGMQASTDPELSGTGRARAERLAAMLGEVGVTALFATEFRRTNQTVEPLAKRTGLAVQRVAAADTAELLVRTRDTGPNAVVVVAGHSNTVPDIIRGLGVRESITIADDEYDNLFVVVPQGDDPPVLLRLKF